MLRIRLKKINFLYAIIISLIVVCMCSISNLSFFFFDDAQNEFLPYLRGVGRIWLRGEIPIIVKDTFIGQNQLIDMHRAIFLPQNIILSIISTKIESFKIMSALVAFVNTSIMAYFSLKLSEALSLKKHTGVILAFLFCINPIYIYIYLPSWWNGASSQAWFVGALASIFLLRKKFCIKYLLLNIITVLCLLSIGWSHGGILYGIVAFSFVIEKIYQKEYKELVFFLLISMGIILIASNLYLEYLISLGALDRTTGFGNFGNFLSPNFNQILMTFNPVYYTFINRFGGYLITYIPMAYSSIYIIILFCYQKKFRKFFIQDANIKFISVLLIISLILTQTPSQFGQIRIAFRFLPFFSEFLIIFSIYGIEKSKLEFTKIRTKIFVGVLFTTGLFSFFSVETGQLKIVLINLLYILLSVIYVYIIFKYKKLEFFYSIFYTVFMFSLILFMQRDVGGFLSFPKVKDGNKVKFENKFNKKGYLLSLTNGNEKRNDVEDLISAQFLLYNIKAINGYTPIGNRRLSELLDTKYAHRLFNINSTVNKLSQKYDNVCYFDLMNIESIPIYKGEITNEIRSELKNCGFNPKEVRNKDVIYFIKDRGNIIGNISYTSKGIFVDKQLVDKTNIEKYQISTTSEGILVLSKVYWRGYRAYVNGKKINISSEKGLLKLDNIPNGLNNAVLEIRYFPASWRLTLWLGIIGILEIIFTLCYINKKI